MGLKTGFCAILALLAFATISDAALVFLFDFPGNPGSGLVANQTNNTQPSNATVSDFTRTADLGVGSGGLSNGAFSSNNWNQTNTINTAQFISFSITASAGYHLELTNVTFDGQINPTGPTNVRVGLFLNGSSTAFATQDLAPTTGGASYNFDFTDLTAADNATSVTVAFFAWNAGGSGGQFAVDNVATNGSITNLPEVAPTTAIGLLLACVFAERGFRRVRNRVSLTQ